MWGVKRGFSPLPAVWGCPPEPENACGWVGGKKIAYVTVTTADAVFAENVTTWQAAARRYRPP